MASRCGGVYRPLKELKGFQKVFLKAGEEQKLILPLDERTFSYFNVQKNQWEVESGEYILLVGASSRDFRLAKRIQMTGEAPQKMSIAEWYYHPDGSPTKEDFETLYGSQIPAYVPATKGTYTLKNSLAEMKETSRLCRVIYRLLEWIVSKSAGIRADRGDPTFRMMVEAAETNPLRTFALMQGKRITMYAVEGLVMVANGSVLQGVRRMLTRRKKDGRG